MNPNLASNIDILESYVKGKDDDQYKLLEAIYAETAELKFEIDSADISFPSKIIGNIDIAKVLSKDFNQKYNNVKTYYLAKPETDQLTIHHQKWLVVMQEKSNHATRVGTGYYNWDLAEGESGLVIQNHKIYIHSMIQITNDQTNELSRIQSELDYPWTTPTNVIKTLANEPNYLNIIRYLQKQN